MTAAKLNDSVALECDSEFRDNAWRARQNGRVVDISPDNPSLVYVDWSTDGRELPGAALGGGTERVHVDQLRVTYAAPSPPG